ncbi:cytochrome c-type biogenesis protein [Arhodomonas sp. SL1]|uniref:cytochrome c-type biogenesis protein n=1 Tax=Arhodomonas sp. SL1 TaxID=3425691 RepID=UPI003F884204
MRWLLLAAALAWATVAGAAGTVYEFESEEQRAQYTQLINHLRCLVCQGQSIAESNADLAKDMRAKVQELVREGRGEEGVIEYMTARYGDFVLYRPPVDQRTWLLWFGPFALIAVAVFALLFAIRRVRGRRPEPALSAEEHRRAERLLREDGHRDTGDRA